MLKIVFGVSLVLFASTGLTKECLNEEIIQALKTEYDLSETESLSKVAKNVACNSKATGFSQAGGAVIPGEAINIKGKLDYSDVKEACNRNDEEFFRRYQKTLSIRFLPDNATELLQACLGEAIGENSRVDVDVDYGRNCNEIIVSVTWRPRVNYAPSTLTVSRVKPSSNYVCDNSITEGTKLERDKPVNSYCKRKAKNSNQYFEFGLETNEGVEQFGSLTLFNRQLDVQEGQNILERKGNKKIAHMVSTNKRPVTLEKCKWDCERNNRCIAFSYRHKAEGPAYPNECTLYAEPRDKIYLGKYHVMTSGIKDSISTCNK